uniref:Putative secreted protein n=1 Tax=Anopheles darlingi TaxID=43151 RepID=A0A2M4DA59_ANODA
MRLLQWNRVIISLLIIIWYDEQFTDYLMIRVAQKFKLDSKQNGPKLRQRMKHAFTSCQPKFTNTESVFVLCLL